VLSINGNEDATVLGNNIGTKFMAIKPGRSVFQRPNGDWINKRNDAHRAGSVHRRQKEAWDSARDMLHKEGGGELTVMGRNGRIVSKDTIAPAQDPNPPRDREH
jgi:hypothetical protein